ncbi:MAG: phosphatidylglycerophosphatase A [Planctomycetota bacterium]|nr:phosphatidylglycerophosphatase A [Planctomycetota bacterium]MDA1177972.1 phosphatidylglycerophosphatase A [Planctomycetota bacterium]
MGTASPRGTQSDTDRILSWFATLGSVGTFPGGPGTYGAALGVGAYVCLGWLPPSFVFFVGIAACVIGVPICGAAARHFATGDPSQVIWDEFASVLLLCTCLPTTVTSQAWGLLLGFLLHRAFDIFKPPPVAQFEQLPGGWGIMADDLMAGLYAWLILQILPQAFGQ